MALRRLSGGEIREAKKLTFAEAGVRERADLQRVFRGGIKVIDPEVLVIAEEFSDWEDSRRRIDLLRL